MGLGERDELVIGVDRLGQLVGADGDRRQRRDEQAGIEDCLDDRKDVRVNGDPLVEGSVDQQVVDAGGPTALEEIVGRDDAELSLEAEEVLEDGVGEIGLDGILDDRPALAAHPFDVRRDGGDVQGSSVCCHPTGRRPVHRRSRLGA